MVKTQKISFDQTGWDKEIVKPITLTMSKGLWETFKACIPRTQKLNDAVVDLIKQEVSEALYPASQKDFEKFMEEQKGDRSNRSNRTFS